MKDVNEFAKVVIDDIVDNTNIEPLELLDIFERGFNNQNVAEDALNPVELKAYKLGQMASQYDDPEDFRNDYLSDETSKLNESVELTGESISQCDKLFDAIYKDQIAGWDCGLSKDDFYDAFKMGYFGEELPEKEYTGMTDDDYEKYLLVYSYALKISSAEN